MNQLKNENEKLIDDIYNLQTDYEELFDHSSDDYKNYFNYKQTIDKIEVIDSDLYDFIFQNTDIDRYIYTSQLSTLHSIKTCICVEC